MDTNASNEQLHGPQDPEVRHARSDVSVYGISVFGVGLLLFAAIMYLIIGGLFDYFARRAAQRDRLPPFSASRAVGEARPPEPRLQVSPREDLQTLHAAEDAVLNQYGWVDRQAQIVRVPIERAMQMLAKRGLPVQLEESGNTKK